MEQIYNKIDFAKLESKVEMMSEKLNKLDEIENALKDIQKCLNTNHIDVILLKKDVDTIEEKEVLLDKHVVEYENKFEIKTIEIENKISVLNNKVNNLTIKITSIVSIASFIGWIAIKIIWN